MANNDDSAKYWEAQASMWHEKYRDALRHEEDAKRYREALLRIKDLSYGTKERLRLIVTRALEHGSDRS
jgi:hypothetical protein